jgi:hypothetical protein
MSWKFGQRRKVSTTVYIRPDQAELLRQLSAITGVPQAEYIRQAVDLVLAKYEAPNVGGAP